MKLSKTLKVLCLTSCILAACNNSPNAPTTTPSPELPSTPETTPIETADIRPGSKGPKLEVTTVEGEFVIPADFESGLLETNSAQIALLNYLLGQPAYAAGIDEDLLLKIKASIDGEPVMMEILGTRNDPDSEDQIISYRLLDVEAGEEKILEFSVPDTPFLLTGLIDKIEEKTTNRLENRIDIERSATLIVVRALLGEKEADISSIEDLRSNLEKFRQRELIQEFVKKLRAEYRRVENKGLTFEELLERRFGDLRCQLIIDANDFFGGLIRRQVIRRSTRLRRFVQQNCLDDSARTLATTRQIRTSQARELPFPNLTLFNGIRTSQN